MVNLGGRTVEGAFNVAGAPDALKDFHPTLLIQQEFRHPGFTRREEVQAIIDNGRAVFHSDKSGSIQRLLAGEAHSKSTAAIANHEPSGGGGSIPPTGTVTNPITIAEREEYWTNRERGLVGRISELEALIKKSGLAESYCNPDGDINLPAAHHIDRLAILSKKDGFAKGRICKQLAAAGFVVRAAKRK